MAKHGDFIKARYLFVHGLFSGAQILRVQSEISGLKRRSVCVSNQPSQVWNNVDIEESTPIHTEFQCSEFCQFIADAMLMDSVLPESVVMWVHEYGIGDYIPRHRDAAGTVQLIICLEAPSAENGGDFILEVEDREVIFHLERGDALLFEATRYFHRTTPLRSTKICPSPRRSVLVARYFF